MRWLPNCERSPGLVTSAALVHSGSMVLAGSDGSSSNWSPSDRSRRGRSRRSRCRALPRAGSRRVRGAHRQELAVPAGVLGDLIVSNGEGAPLAFGQWLHLGRRNFLQVEQFCRAVPGVASDDNIAFIDQDREQKSDVRDLADLLLRKCPRVARVGLGRRQRLFDVIRLLSTSLRAEPLMASATLNSTATGLANDWRVASLRAFLHLHVSFQIKKPAICGLGTKR